MRKDEVQILPVILSAFGLVPKMLSLSLQKMSLLYLSTSTQLYKAVILPNWTKILWTINIKEQ